MSETEKTTMTFSKSKADQFTEVKIPWMDPEGKVSCLKVLVRSDMVTSDGSIDFEYIRSRLVTAGVCSVHDVHSVPFPQAIELFEYWETNLPTHESLARLVKTIEVSDRKPLGIADGGASSPSLKDILPIRIDGANSSSNPGESNHCHSGSRAATSPLNLKLIEQWVEDEGYDNESLAEKLKVSRRCISSIRNNGNCHGKRSVTKLANLIGVDPSELYLT